MDDLDGPWITYWPKRLPALERAIGRFMIAWGVLEREIDKLFPILFRTDATLAICLYANLGTKAKLDILSSATNMLARLLGEQIVGEITLCIRETRNLSGIARNTLAHGQLWPSASESGEPEGLELIRIASRDSLDVANYPATARHWETLAAKVMELAKAWASADVGAYRALKGVADSQIDEVCVYSQREIEPAYSSRPRHPRPKTPASKGRSPKRAQPRQRG
jgi:hypothetical protein